VDAAQVNAKYANGIARDQHAGARARRIEEDRDQLDGQAAGRKQIKA
jgi:hypothetical protein